MKLYSQAMALMLALATSSVAFAQTGTQQPPQQPSQPQQGTLPQQDTSPQ